MSTSPTNSPEGDLESQRHMADYVSNIGASKGTMVLQLVVGDQRGLNVESLYQAIQNHYRTRDGKPVKVHPGDSGRLPPSFWLLRDDDTREE